MKTVLDRLRRDKADELGPGEEFLAGVVLVSRGTTAQQRATMAAVAGGLAAGMAGRVVASKIAMASQHYERLPPGYRAPNLGLVVMGLTNQRILLWRRGSVSDKAAERVGAFPIQAVRQVRYARGKGVSDLTILLDKSVALQCEAKKDQKVNVEQFVQSLSSLQQGPPGAAPADG